MVTCPTTPGRSEVTVGGTPAPMLRQPGLRQAVDDALKFSRFLVRQDARALAQQELRIDLEQFRPGQPRLFQPSEMAVAGGEQHTARIGGGRARDAREEMIGAMFGC